MTPEEFITAQCRDIDDDAVAPVAQAAAALKIPAIRKRFVLYHFDSVKLDRASTYLIKGLADDTGLAIVWGPPKCGKSFWVFDLLMHVAVGRDYRGNRVKQKHVVYCVLEGQKGFRRRMEAFRIEKMERGDRALFSLMESPLRLPQDTVGLIEDIREHLGDKRPGVVCLDTLNRSMEGSESSDADMAAYLRAADAIGKALDCLVVIIHHCGHNGVRPRGHSSLMGALDLQVAVRRIDDNVIEAELELAKDTEAGLTFRSRLKQVTLFIDEEGDPVTSCVVEEVDQPCKGSRSRWPDSLRVFKQAFEEALISAGRLSTPRAGMPEVRAVDLEVVRTEFKRLYVPSSSDPKSATRATNEAFRRCIDSARGRG
jgi:hypothetical protein